MPFNDIVDPCQGDARSGRAPETYEAAMSTLRTRPDLFQMREQKATERHHVEMLCKALRNGDGPFDPLTVWREPDKRRLYVIDGHHRIAAYRRFGWTQTVPVIIHRCPYRQALLLVSAENRKTRLPVSYAEKADWAWRLVSEGGNTQEAIASSAGVSRSTLTAMAKALRKISAEGTTPSTSWSAARMQANGEDFQPMTKDERDAQRQQRAERLAKQIRGAMSKAAKRDAEEVAMALEIACGTNFFAAVVSHAVDLVGLVAVNPDEWEERQF